MLRYVVFVTAGRNDKSTVAAGFREFPSLYCRLNKALAEASGSQRTWHKTCHRVDTGLNQPPEKRNSNRNAFKLENMMKNRYFTLLALSAALASSYAHAVPYSFQSVAVPGDNFTQLLGVNNAGTIVGYHGANTSPANPNQGFVFTQPNTFTPQNFPFSVQTQVVGINIANATVGFYVDKGGATHGFEFQPGGIVNPTLGSVSASQFTNIDAPSSAFTQLLGLNDQGQTVGYGSQDPGGGTKQLAFLRQADGQFAFISKILPGATFNSQATEINNLGVISGFYLSDPTTSHGFLIDSRNNYSFVQLDVPGSTFTQALGLNDLGQVDGFYNDSTGIAHGFLYANGKYQTIDAPGALQTTINGINDKGEIVGFFLDAQENTIGFVGTPVQVPEPHSMLLLATGLLGLGSMGSLRRTAIAQQFLIG